MSSLRRYDIMAAAGWCGMQLYGVNMEKTAIFPGSFDPVTLGHINIIKRAANAFDKVIVCVSVNSEKNGGLFTPAERLELLRKSIQVENVEFDINDATFEWFDTRTDRMMAQSGKYNLLYGGTSADEGLKVLEVVRP